MRMSREREFLGEGVGVRVNEYMLGLIFLFLIIWFL